MNSLFQHKENVIGIIGAMEEEVIEIKELMEILDQREIAGLTFYFGELNNKNVVLVRCGIGKVNAAMCTQILIDTYHTKKIVNIGVAGAISNALEIGDIVISSDAVHHDFDVTAFGHKKGIIPRMDESFFKADNELVELAKAAGEKIINDHKVYVERIVSGDQFVADFSTKKIIFDEFAGYCTEMEGAAIAHVCCLNKVPFVVIRAISDKADESADVNFDEFTALAAKNASKMIQEMLNNF